MLNLCEGKLETLGPCLICLNIEIDQLFIGPSYQASLIYMKIEYSAQLHLVCVDEKLGLGLSQWVRCSRESSHAGWY